ncbi:MAG: hypothetical protein QM820_29685 [Minicystis sp.]
MASSASSCWVIASRLPLFPKIEQGNDYLEKINLGAREPYRASLPAPGRSSMSKRSAPSHPPPAPKAGADPFVDELVERAAARYAGLVDPAALAEMKDELRMFLTAHPKASRVVDRARPRVDRERSAEEPAADVPEAPAARGKAKGDPR